MDDHNVALDVAGAIRQNPDGLARGWVEVLCSDPVCQTQEVLVALEGRLSPVLMALSEALESAEPHLAAPGFRSVVRELAFLGGWLAGQGASASLAARLITAFTDSVSGLWGADILHWRPWRALEIGLTAVVVETYCLNIRAAQRDRRLEMLERCTPILRLPNDIPALLVVGNPSRQVLSALLGRLLMEVARLGAELLLVDFSNARDLEDDALDVIGELLEHRKLQQREVCVSGLKHDQVRRLKRELGARQNVRYCEDWVEALEIARKKD